MKQREKVQWLSELRTFFFFFTTWVSCGLVHYIIKVIITTTSSGLTGPGLCRVRARQRSAAEQNSQSSLLTEHITSFSNVVPVTRTRASHRYSTRVSRAVLVFRENRANIIKTCSAAARKNGSIKPFLPKCLNGDQYKSVCGLYFESALKLGGQIYFSRPIENF